MKNKKAMLLTEEVLKMIIAVIGLALLSYFLVSFFYSDVQAKKQKQATETLDKISQIILKTNLSQATVSTLQPQRWTLFSFTGEEKKPNQCSEQNCICICNKVFVDVFNRQIKKCSKKGACLIIPNLQEFEDIKIKKYKEAITSVNVEKIGGKIQITEI